MHMMEHMTRKAIRTTRLLQRDGIEVFPFIIHRQPRRLAVINLGRNLLVPLNREYKIKNYQCTLIQKLWHLLFLEKTQPIMWINKGPIMTKKVHPLQTYRSLKVRTLSITGHSRFFLEGRKALLTNRGLTTCIIPSAVFIQTTVIKKKIFRCCSSNTH
mmetsp:Transcript_42710/g.69658  ORF Transcript_42710/g.69658 Transcript_42710/m.69658 type:complete len:158 (-) Transcript_42710:337-810(-)